MAAKLKVYATRIGFHDAVVAAPNQAAALAAWDVRENLFAQGAAAVSDDPKAVKAALAHPGVVLRRAAGGKADFSETPAPPPAPKGAARAKARPAPKPEKPKPDRSALDAAERALLDLDGQAEALAVRRKALEKDRDRAARAYVKAGGQWPSPD